MPVIPVDLDALKEMKPVPHGKYSLTISTCEEVLSKNGKPQYDVSISIDGHEDAPNMRHFVSLPAEGDEMKALQFKALLLKRFCTLFKLPLTGGSIDTTAIAMALPGKKVIAEVTLDKELNPDGSEKPGGRTFNRLVVPVLDNAPAGSRTAPPPPKS